MTAPWILSTTTGALALFFFARYLRSRRHLHKLRTRLGEAARELERLQASFARFAPRDIVEQVIADELATGGDKKEVTVLFADLVGFTTMSEALDPDLLVRVLNGYFARMSKAISTSRGHVAKFIGDGILALFGAIEPNPWQANDAAHAALAMREELRAYNVELAAQGVPALRAGIGIHKGVAVAGVFGSGELVEFTVVGGNVNMAARVERLTRAHGAEILVTASVKAALDPRFILRELPPVRAPGVRDPIATFALEGFDAGPGRGGLISS